MGCTASKLDNEDTVRQCKERRRLMKEAVYARHHLAAAHSDYLRSLRLTGSALSDFAAGEPLAVSDGTGPVFLRTPSSVSQRQPQPPPPPPPQSASAFAPPPPPPQSEFFPPSPSITSSKVPHILSASNVSSIPRRRPMKLPHILSESSLSSTPSHKSGGAYNYPANSNYPSTPSQASSMWNWENFYPPSPPGSDFFRRPNDDDHQSQHSDNHHHQQNHNLDHDEDEETAREEVHCSDWGDRYSTTSSDSKSDYNDDEADRDSRSEIGTTSNFGSSVHNDAASQFKYPPRAKSEKSEEAGSSVSWNANTGEISDLKMVVRHRDLAEIVASIKEYFDKAASAGDTVSELLETGRAQLDRSFRQLKKTVYHSSGVLSNLSSSWTSKPPLAVKYRLDAGSLVEPGGSKSHCSTLERLYAWEKKLYEEVKAREGVKIEHEKKLSSLQSQEYRGEGDVKLDKTKAAITKLQSLIVVTSQAVSTTSSAIIHVRDTELGPQLVELCHGFMYMWRSMHQCHEMQNLIVEQVKGLENRSVNEKSTSELHRQATRYLESAVSAWHSSFSRLVKYHRDYIRSLYGWLKLTLIYIGNDSTTGSKDPSLAAQASSDLFAFCDEWKQALDRLPDTVASESIKSFVNVVHVISVKQGEELKQKKRTETASKELEKKALALRNIEKKFYQSYSMIGIGLPDGGGSDNGQVLDARDPLAEKKSELAACQIRVEDEMLKHAKAVEVTRAMTLNNVQTGLPGVFQAMTGFSGLFTEVLEGVCARSYAIK